LSTFFKRIFKSLSGWAAQLKLPANAGKNYDAIAMRALLRRNVAVCLRSALRLATDIALYTSQWFGASTVTDVFLYTSQWLVVAELIANITLNTGQRLTILRLVTNITLNTGQSIICRFARRIIVATITVLRGGKQSFQEAAN
jgi:hypothetical protein